LPAHECAHTPQLLGSLWVSVSHAFAGFLSQSAKPAAQRKPQSPAVHDAVAWVAGHGVHDVGPHELTSSLETHAPPQTWKPGLHTQPHAPAALQVAVAFAGAAHGVHDAPHVAGSTLLAHALPHT